MGGYLLNFVVYTLAMVGVIFAAVFVYKKTAVSAQSSSKNKYLKVEDAINLGPRKQLFVVKAGNERFLVASDAERTNLISKLEAAIPTKQEIKTTVKEVEDFDKTRYFDQLKNSNSAIVNFAKRINR